IVTEEQDVEVMKEQPTSYNLKREEMCGKNSPLNEENHDEPGVELHSDANGVEMGYYNNDGNIFTKRDIHSLERNEVVMVPTSDIMIASCDDPRGCSKKKNEELIINGTRYWNTDRLTIKKPKANRGKTEHKTEGGTMFVSMWESWNPEDSRNDDITEKRSTNNDKLADKDHCSVVSSGTRHGNTDGLTDGRPDVSGSGLGCHEDRGMITDDPLDKNKTEDETKGGMVELMIAYVDVIAKLIHCTIMIIVMMVLITNGTVSKTECVKIMRRIGSISRKASWYTERWKERECKKKTQRRLQPTKIHTDHIIIKESTKKG
ncbi:1112_t:CDS:2, partial [Acaulospora morrowiae]